MKIRLTRKASFGLIAISLAVIGLFPMVTGLLKLDEARIEQEQVIEYEPKTNIREVKQVSGNSVGFSAIVNNQTITASYTFNFQTRDVFAVDNRIDYHVTLFVSDPNIVEDAAIVFGDEKHDFSKIESNDLKSFVTLRSNLFGDTVHLFRSEKDPRLFERTGYIIFPLEMNLRLYFLTKAKDGAISQIPTRESIISISPALAKLQADTNRATLEQITKLEESTKAQNVSNKTIEGLSWIALGVVPLVICADILLRIYLGEKTLLD